MTSRLNRLPAPAQGLARYGLSVLLFVCVVATAGAADGNGLEEHTFDSAGVKIRYVVAGEGPPLVLIHGFSGNIEHDWVRTGVLQKLSKDIKVIAIDARGHGQSDKPHDPAAYGAPMALDVVRLLDELHIDKAFVAGYSMGGFLTLKLVTLAPERLSGAVIGGAGWMVHPNGEGEEWHENFAKSIENGEGITELMLTLVPKGEAPPSPQYLDMVNAMVMSRNDPQALAAFARGQLLQMVDGDEIDHIKVPVLAVVGERDPMRAMVDALRFRNAAVEVHVIAGADHGSALSSPELPVAIHDFVGEVCHCLQ